MATTPDPTAALNLFQRDLDRTTLSRSPTDPDLLFHLDQPDGSVRLTFARLQDRTVTALAVFFAADPTDGVLRFHGFYAVPEALRNQGRAKDILGAALRQMEYGFAQTQVDAIRVEVIVDAGNTAAQHVAAAVISPSPTPVTDEVSGRPALLYGATLKHMTH
jgi:RimJ/RimL family protein N-acetyltransferase